MLSLMDESSSDESDLDLSKLNLQEHTNNLSVDDSIALLLECEWIHNFQMTNILEDNVWQCLNTEWLSHMKSLTINELNQLPFDAETSAQKYPSWPESLHQFLSRASSLSLARQPCPTLEPTSVDVNMAKGMNPKKQHEVSLMASLVVEIMKQTKCSMVVDVGSGLGYLDHVLHQVYGYPVLGLEVSDCHNGAAGVRAGKQGLQCGGVASKGFLVSDTEECHRDFEVMVAEAADRFSRQCGHSLLNEAPVCKPPRVCLVGLHSCGDLSVSMASLFDAVGCVKAMVGVACCYHKMQYYDGEFFKFPLSDQAKESIARVQTKNPSFHLCPFSFRLGAQETRLRWVHQSSEEHIAHSHQVFFRALLELTDFENEMIHPTVKKCDFTSLESFMESFAKSGNLKSEDAERFRAEFQRLYEKHQDSLGLIEPFACLQVIVQPVIESLIYRDRQLWLHERGHNSAQIVPIFDEAISPRNLALVATKP